jgi:hypothetical protein
VNHGAALGSAVRPPVAPACRSLPAGGWDEGRRPGRQVLVLAAGAALAVAALNIALTGRLSVFFDLTFVVICLVSAWGVRPRDAFAVGVMPPLLMLGVVVLLATLARDTVADPVDPPAQAVVTGLAHHAGGLAGGYFAALLLLGLRQAARTPAKR